MGMCHHLELLTCTSEPEQPMRGKDAVRSIEKKLKVAKTKIMKDADDVTIMTCRGLELQNLQ